MLVFLFWALLLGAVLLMLGNGLQGTLLGIGKIGLYGGRDVLCDIRAISLAFSSARA
ncbi:MAG: hypothetical protein R3D56_05055 [Paracoccaceae bacterium]